MGVFNLAERGRIREAVDLESLRIAEINKIFTSDEASAGKYVYYRVRAYAQDWFAEKGPLSTKPRGDLGRSYLHLSAALDYMRTDVEYGYATPDYGFKIGDCLAAAGMPKLQRLSLLKAWGRDIEIWGVPDFGSPQILRLEQKLLDHIHQ